MQFTCPSSDVCRFASENFHSTVKDRSVKYKNLSIKNVQIVRYLFCYFDQRFAHRFSSLIDHTPEDAVFVLQKYMRMIKFDGRAGVHHQHLEKLILIITNVKLNTFKFEYLLYPNP